VRALLILSELTRGYLVLEGLLFTNNSDFYYKPINSDEIKEGPILKIGGMSECYFKNDQEFNVKRENIDASPYYRLADRRVGNQIAYVEFLGEAQELSSLPGTLLDCYNTGQGY
jgi:hypothetical protein